MNLPRITFKEKKLNFYPDPIIVREGENIEIELFADLTNSEYSLNDILKYKNLIWRIHFKNGNPFYPEPYKIFEFRTHIGKYAPTHSDIVPLGIAQNRGEYKFDITLAKDSESNYFIPPKEYVEDDLIGELDPIIIVI